MNRKSVVRALALTGWLLAACLAGPAVTDATAQRIACAGASCDVEVTVTGTAASPPVVISAKDLEINPKVPNVVITWQLVGAPTFEFRADSIRPHTTGPVGPKLTTTVADWSQIVFLNNTATAYRVRHLNTVRKKLFYDIYVYDKATGKSFKLDPVIINDL
jgi:hypothetical protein